MDFGWDKDWDEDLNFGWDKDLDENNWDLEDKALIETYFAHGIEKKGTLYYYIIRFNSFSISSSVI